jgi:methylmalonyl-CoA mutase C-terminal domain/subunit
MLRDAGYEVIYLGLHNYADNVVKVAIEDDVDAVGISFLSGQHMTQMKRLLEQMRSQGFSVPIFCGGVIPPDDAAQLKAMGVAEVFQPGTLSDEVKQRIERILSLEAV